jgi:hypothetical protein
LLVVATSAGAAETFVATFVPRTGSGSSGSGGATLVLNEAGTELSYNISYTGLTGPELAAHIHAPDGSIIHHLPLGSPKVGVWSNPGFIDIVNLRADNLFILIHTEANPGGELRGNITSQELPVEAGTWGRIKALYR